MACIELGRHPLPRLGLAVATRPILVVLPIEGLIGTDWQFKRGGHDRVHLMHEFLLLGVWGRHDFVDRGSRRGRQGGNGKALEDKCVFAELGLKEGVEWTGERRVEGFGVDGLRYNAVRLYMAWR